MPGYHRRQPGGGIRYTASNLKRAYESAGYDRVASDTGTNLNFDTGFEIKSFPEGRVSKQFPLIAPALTTERDSRGIKGEDAYTDTYHGICKKSLRTRARPGKAAVPFTLP